MRPTHVPGDQRHLSVQHSLWGETLQFPISYLFPMRWNPVSNLFFMTETFQFLISNMLFIRETLQFLVSNLFLMRWNNSVPYFCLVLYEVKLFCFPSLTCFWWDETFQLCSLLYEMQRFSTSPLFFLGVELFKCRQLIQHPIGGEPFHSQKLFIFKILNLNIYKILLLWGETLYFYALS